MTQKKLFVPIVLIFIFINSFALISKNFLLNHGFDQELLLWGNFLLFFIGITALLIQFHGLKAANPNVFVRSVYIVMIVKLFIVAIVLTTYILLNHRNINKPALFTLMGLYIVYTAVEVSSLMKTLRNKNEQD
jgi:hypothetical protein